MRLNHLKFKRLPSPHRKKSTSIQPNKMVPLKQIIPISEWSNPTWSTHRKWNKRMITGAKVITKRTKETLLSTMGMPINILEKSTKWMSKADPRSNAMIWNSVESLGYRCSKYNVKLKAMQNPVNIAYWRKFKWAYFSEYAIIANRNKKTQPTIANARGRFIVFISI